MTLVGGADYDIIDPHTWERLWQVEWKRLYGLYNDAAVGQDEIKPPRKEASTEDTTTLAHHLTHNAFLVEVNPARGSPVLQAPCTCTQYQRRHHTHHAVISQHSHSLRAPHASPTTSFLLIDSDV